ncbi:Heat shock protein E [Delftia tsuruhatensis]|uniref:fimbria/pilus outer membrane usher protein n=1 Tax=Delftia tsuruhatensis TaxID=180282 RepID=UPI001E7E6886|nr:fimbria/pilus outer membrane usher protein [Delftia tsuruhatensis]CAB5715392.1 Heat shock protein E [Delftia tsuruhatensis]CAC9676714.1 Heat shock protein E [Delftia tsuruhatensis]
MKQPSDKAGTSRRFTFRAKPLHALLLAILAGWQIDMPASNASPVPGGRQPSAQGSHVEFNSSFLRGTGNLDISRFAYGNVAAPGLHSPDIRVNGSWIGRMELRFAEAQPGAGAYPCFDRTLLERLGVDLGRLTPREGDAGDAASRTGDEAANDGSTCLRLEQAVPGASTRFNASNLQLDLGIPQILMRRTVRGYVSPDQWSAGVPAGLLGYNFNTYHARNGSRGGSHGYLGLNSGFNYERWHLRHNGSLSWSDSGRNSYQNISTYVQRDIADWSSQLILGDSFTDGELMSAVSFRGLRLRTDDRMLPESQRGFAPVVRGVANTNARVTVYQNRNKLYETTVAPGAFVIDDLFPTSYGGDLDVEIAEADGSVRTFSVPYAAVPRSLREGRHRYSLTGGIIRGLPQNSPFFTQASWQYGFSNAVTAYGGATLAKGYASPMVGAVLNTEWGAFGLDLTHASTRIPQDRSYSGQSLRATYAKSFQETGTNVALATYRYSTSGYFDLNDALRTRDLVQAGRPPGLLQRTRSQTALTLGQQLGPGSGSLGLSASVVNYWNRGGRHVNFSANYSNVWGRVPYNLSVSRQRDAWGKTSTLLYAGLTIPLGTDLPSVSSRMSRDSRGMSQIQASTYGQIGSDFTYGLDTEYSNGANGSGQRVSANATYRTPFADLSGSVGAGNGGRQLSAGARGAIVAHPGGVTLSQPLSETFGIVQAKDAEGAQLRNYPGVRINSSGYAVVPHLTPYAMNELSLDPKGISMDVELKETRQRVAPVAGAAAMVVFGTEYSRSAVVRSRQEDGSPVPFGATISDAGGKDLGVVGQAGKLLLRGLKDQGELQAQWTTKAGPASCGMAYALPQRQGGTGNTLPPSLELSCVAKTPGTPVQVAKAQAPQPVALAATPRPRPADERMLDDLRLSVRLGSSPSAPSATPQRTAAMTPEIRNHADALAQQDLHAHPLRLERLLPGLAPMLISAIRNSST